MPRVALYARVSTSEQRVEPQLHALHSYAGARGLDVAGEYLDEDISGDKDRRPALDRLLSDARRRAFDVVACVKLDRLARSVHHLTSLALEFQALGIDLVVLDQTVGREERESLLGKSPPTSPWEGRPHAEAARRPPYIRNAGSRSREERPVGC